MPDLKIRSDQLLHYRVLIGFLSNLSTQEVEICRRSFSYEGYSIGDKTLKNLLDKMVDYGALKKKERKSKYYPQKKRFVNPKLLYEIDRRKLYEFARDYWKVLRAKRQGRTGQNETE